MRLIKFRAWSKEDKVMIHDLNTPRLVHGELKDCDDDYILMQFTGLHDRNKKEIYEGDILQGYDWNDDYSEQNVPSYKYKIDSEFTSSCGCCSKIHGWEIANPSEEDVIGNIYENPDIEVSTI